ncbi:MAG: RNA polymerase sigma factor [Anaerolineales bacterium]|nr:MAG: RNA polymerase sigma factor [Anaerolineales bacterium]
MEDKLDQDLILELQAGELDALGDMYDRHRHLVYRTALAITCDPDMASDLLQEVFLRLHRFAERIDPSRPLQPWLYRMTVNLSYTWIKRKSRWIRYLNEMAENIIMERRPASPHNIAERDESWRWVRQAILALPVQQRMVVVLYYINDLSLKEISEILEIPVGTVKSRLHYARRVLKKQLGTHREVLRTVFYETT